MSKKPILPIAAIGEINWVDNLKSFLSTYEVVAKGIPLQNEVSLISFGFGDQIRSYYKHFGATESAEFMYYLKRYNELEWLHTSRYSKTLTEYFPLDELSNFVIIGESLHEDPICLNIQNQRIYTFTKKPSGMHILFNSFNDYLLIELMNFKKQVCAFDFDNREQERAYLNTIVNDKGIDQKLRHNKLYQG
ncbi:hypothetical protein [Sphingobacterium pedocola]|uniref:IPExxxVDY family protein n=1 Tax=Sphingobacterium pedocola TaxID=2082722 RepID=A0ABR9TCX6_9SPHI|nr:hypothetical protein [Sphingobacterium pedocola]MBE8723191.1 hypothetical protein [Sphingobacterium pedocola]